MATTAAQEYTPYHVNDPCRRSAAAAAAVGTLKKTVAGFPAMAVSSLGVTHSFIYTLAHKARPHEFTAVGASAAGFGARQGCSGTHT